ncbi:hypothetical protein AOLI_G00060200 [Acnodon oligacanthus]
MQEPIVFVQHQQAVGGSMALRVSTPVGRALQVNDPRLLPATLSFRIDRLKSERRPSREKNTPAFSDAPRPPTGCAVLLSSLGRSHGVTAEPRPRPLTAQAPPTPLRRCLVLK